MRVGALAIAIVLGAGAAHAQDAGVAAGSSIVPVPFVEEAPHVDAASHAVIAVGLGVADERRGPLPARRLSARRDAEARARAALHGWVDQAIAPRALPMSTIAALHAAVDHDTVVTGTRARVDGSATVAVSLPLASLAAVTTGTRGLPWSA